MLAKFVPLLQTPRNGDTAMLQQLRLTDARSVGHDDNIAFYASVPIGEQSHVAYRQCDQLLPDAFVFGHLSPGSNSLPISSCLILHTVLQPSLHQ